MRIAVLTETNPDETRVAATPDTVKRYRALGVAEIADFILTQGGIAPRKAA